MKAKNLCIIPARGGSKRIPRKNIKDFLGKPIIAYSIEIALESGLFDEIMVSTDDAEIAEISKKYGAKVPYMRSEKNSDDFAVLADVVEEVLEFYKGINIEFACCILPTAPLIRLDYFIQSFELLKSGKFDSIRPIVKFSYPIQRAVRLSEDSGISFFYPEFAKSRSQDLEDAYHDAGQFYWFRGAKGMKSENKGAIIIPEKWVQDIDTREDWELAELKYKLLNS
jgi:pseudaminic acid cytidylyltransferase